VNGTRTTPAGGNFYLLLSRTKGQILIIFIAHVVDEEVLHLEDYILNFRNKLARATLEIISIVRFKFAY
jgi:hypothetical protein